MGYRLPDHQHHHHHGRPRHLVDAATPSVVCIDNGAIARIEIPCSYINWFCHDRVLHDHLGWPEPRHVDKSCQLPAGMDKVAMVDEMNLPDEGYTDVEIVFANAPEGLSAEGIIDYDSIWITFTAYCNDAIDKDVDVPFTVFACGLGMNIDGDMSMPLRDVVLKGTLHIIAGPYANLS